MRKLAPHVFSLNRNTELLDMSILSYESGAGLDLPGNKARASYRSASPHLMIALLGYYHDYANRVRHHRGLARNAQVVAEAAEPEPSSNLGEDIFS